MRHNLVIDGQYVEDGFDLFVKTSFPDHIPLHQREALRLAFHAGGKCACMAVNELINGLVDYNIHRN